LLPETVNTQRHHISGLKENGGRKTKADARGGASDHDITGH
jgi:hypothetical protein